MTDTLIKPINDFKVRSFGMDNAQYFTGVTNYRSGYNEVFLGAGMDAKEAYEDALEQLTSFDWDVNSLPKKVKGINKKEKVPAKYAKEDFNEMYIFVAIWVK